jgi:hypothetical protein
LKKKGRQRKKKKKVLKELRKQQICKIGKIGYSLKRREREWKRNGEG